MSQQATPARASAATPRRRARRLHPLAPVVLALALAAGGDFPLAPQPALARQQPGEPAAAPAQAPEFSISRLAVAYDSPDAGLPSIQDLLDKAPALLTISPEGVLARDGGADAPGPTLAQVNQRLADAGPLRFSRAALEEATRAIVRALNTRGFIGVLVAIEPDDISIDVRRPGSALASPENEWADLRPGAAGEVRITIYTARVVRVRTVASGQRVPAGQGVDHPLHDRIREGSPIRPEPDGPSILRRDLIDRYTHLLNRRPGRRVDVAVSAAENPGEIVLDYLVRENKPWIVFAQVANTGTRQTEEVRQRFGFIHNQLTGNDDQLVIDFITGGFAGTYGVVGSYDFPLSDRIRLRPFATYSRFDASQVGFADSGFRGENWAVGGDLSWNFLQRRELFVDLVAGMRWESVRVNNRTVDLVGEDDFLLPSVGLRLERFTEEASTTAYLRAEWNLAGVAATGDPQLERLGRTDPDAHFTVIQFGAEQSFYLEPLLDAQRFREGRSTLAHEIALRFSGQHALGARLAPSFQGVVGGLDTVRGYPESAVAGDNTYIAGAEYRLHIPRLLAPYDETGGVPMTVAGEPFRLRPQTRYARPDWDLITKIFIDAGRTENSDRLSFESNDTLIGTGWGIELLLGRNFSLRLDWGVVLREVEEPTRVTRGSSRLHFVVTVLF